MKASELAKICLQNPDWEVSIRFDGVDDIENFDIIDADEKIILCVDFPEPEPPEDTRMFL